MRFLLVPAFLLALLFPAMAQFPAPQGGPVAIGQAQLTANPAGGVALIQAPAVAAPSGGIIQLSALGWLQPYADSILQALIAAGFAWFAKSKYSTMLDEASRDALKTFAMTRASSLIADGFVSVQGRSVVVPSAALAREAATANAAIPDALKRFGLTPEIVAAKIVDAIPQVAAGAALIIHAHTNAPPVTSIPAADTIAPVVS